MCRRYGECMREEDFEGVADVEIRASGSGVTGMISLGAGYDGGDAILTAEEARTVARDLLAAADWLEGKLTYLTADAFPERLPGKPA